MKLLLLILLLLLLLLLLSLSLIKPIELFNNINDINPIFNPIFNSNIKYVDDFTLKSLDIKNKADNIIYLPSNYNSAIFNNNDELSPEKIEKYSPQDNYDVIIDPKPTLNCCLVEKKYVNDTTNDLGGNFKYEYKKLDNENCDLKLFKLDQNKQVLYDGINDWSNNNCVDNNNILGSCRNNNKECIDFVTKDFCDKYNKYNEYNKSMIWSNKTCQDSLEYVWNDKSTFNYDKPDTDGTYNFFGKNDTSMDIYSSEIFASNDNNNDYKYF
jgi:hypothetical protein